MAGDAVAVSTGGLGFTTMLVIGFTAGWFVAVLVLRLPGFAEVVGGERLAVLRAGGAGAPAPRWSGDTGTLPLVCEALPGDCCGTFCETEELVAGVAGE